MQTELQTEVMLCPNCREEVPKTLYCLNCGYPLYKVAMQSVEEEVEDVSIEVAPEAGAEPIIEIEAQQETPVVEELQETVEEESPALIEELEEAEAGLEEPESLEAVEEELLEELQADEGVEETLEPLQEETLEETQLYEEDVEEPEPHQEIAVEPLVAETLEVDSDIFDEIEEIEDAIPEIDYSFEPDPVIKEVMVNLAKNISLKVRLVDLLNKGEVKEETFNRLFENYAARGERLINSRIEMVERIRFDLEAMEKSLSEANVGLEELEIKRAIGDVSQEEYNAKAPAFQWDIGKYKDEARRKKGELAYLSDLTRVIPAAEIAQLKETARSCHACVDEMVDANVASPQNVARIKSSLDDVIAYLEGAN
jgi:copper chaperone CopZ